MWHFLLAPRDSLTAAPPKKNDARIERRVEAYIREEEDDELEEIAESFEDGTIDPLLSSTLLLFVEEPAGELAGDAPYAAPFVYINQLPAWLPPTLRNALSRTHSDNVVVVRRGKIAPLIAQLEQGEGLARKQALSQMEAAGVSKAKRDAWERASLAKVDWPVPGRRGPFEEPPEESDALGRAIAVGAMMKRARLAAANAVAARKDLVLIFGRGLAALVFDVEALEGIVASKSKRAAKDYFKAVRPKSEQRLRKTAVYMIDLDHETPQDHLMGLTPAAQSVELDDHETVLGEYLRRTSTWDEKPGKNAGYRTVALSGKPLVEFQRALEDLWEGEIDAKTEVAIAVEYGPSDEVVGAVLREFGSKSKHPNRKKMEKLRRLAKEAEADGQALFVVFER